MAYENQIIDEEDLGVIVGELANGPLIFVGIVEFWEGQYIVPAELSADERAHTERVMQRLSCGVFQQKIDSKTLLTLNAHLSNVNEAGEMVMRDSLTPAELAAFVADAEAMANQAMMPDEPCDVDIAGEFGRAVDSAINSSSSSTP
ncbi:MAG: hypothetical protein HN348_13680 [Proteobacteria bacterium]|nr:hypothetical protein [Pseudomonadota bacterium]